MTLTTVESLSTVEVSDATGLSFRQIDYYTRNGQLGPLCTGAGGGSGSRRRWDPSTVWILRVILGLFDAQRLGQPPNTGNGSRLGLVGPLVEQLHADYPDVQPSPQVWVWRSGRVLRIDDHRLESGWPRLEFLA